MSTGTVILLIVIVSVLHLVNVLASIQSIHLNNNALQKNNLKFIFAIVGFIVFPFGFISSLFIVTTTKDAALSKEYELKTQLFNTEMPSVEKQKFNHDIEWQKTDDAKTLKDYEKYTTEEIIKMHPEHYQNDEKN